MDKDLLHKFAHSVAALSDEELDKLQAYYTGLNAALTPCPPEYTLTLHDVYRKLDRINDMKAAREAGRKWCAYQAQKPLSTSFSVRV